MAAERDYDAMYRASQESKLQNGIVSSTNPGYDEQFRQGYAKKEKGREPLTPEVLDPNGRPLQPSKGVSATALGAVSLIIGAVTFLLIFVGMFFHAFLWLDVLFCLIGIGFGIAALLKPPPARALGVGGVILCIFTLLVDVICIAVVAVSSGISALFHLFT